MPPIIVTVTAVGKHVLLLFAECLTLLELLDYINGKVPIGLSAPSPPPPYLFFNVVIWAFCISIFFILETYLVSMVDIFI